MTKEIKIAGQIWPSNVAVVICDHLMGERTVKSFSLDFEGDLIAACGRDDHKMENWKLVSLHQVIEMQPLLNELPLMVLGSQADLSDQSGEWCVSCMSNDN